MEEQLKPDPGPDPGPGHCHTGKFVSKRTSSWNERVVDVENPKDGFEKALLAECRKDTADANFKSLESFLVKPGENYSLETDFTKVSLESANINWLENDGTTVWLPSSFVLPEYIEMNCPIELLWVQRTGFFRKWNRWYYMLVEMTDDGTACNIAKREFHYKKRYVGPIEVFFRTFIFLFCSKDQSD